MLSPRRVTLTTAIAETDTTTYSQELVDVFRVRLPRTTVEEALSRLKDFNDASRGIVSPRVEEFLSDLAKHFSNYGRDNFHGTRVTGVKREYRHRIGSDIVGHPLDETEVVSASDNLAITESLVRDGDTQLVLTSVVTSYKAVSLRTADDIRREIGFLSEDFGPYELTKHLAGEYGVQNIHDQRDNMHYLHLYLNDTYVLQVEKDGQIKWMLPESA